MEDSPRELLTLEVNDDEPEGRVLWTGTLSFSQLETTMVLPARLELEIEPQAEVEAAD